MAKYKSSRLGSKQFLTLSALAVSVFGLIFVVNAVQKPTSTRSDAAIAINPSAVCSTKPSSLSFTGSTSQSNSVTYNLKIGNDNPKLSCDKDVVYGLKIENKPNENWKFTFSQTGNSLFSRCPYGFLSNGEIDKASVKVVPNASAKNGTHSFTVKACQAVPAGGADCECCLGLTNNCIDKTLKYVKTSS